MVFVIFSLQDCTEPIYFILVKTVLIVVKLTISNAFS
jgi:hypothetical protein